AQAAGRGAGGAPAAGDRAAAGRHDLRRDRGAGGTDPDRGVQHLQAPCGEGRRRAEERPARARAGHWALPRCGAGGGGPRADPPSHTGRVGPVLRALEPGGGAGAGPAALRGPPGGPDHGHLPGALGLHRPEAAAARLRAGPGGGAALAAAGLPGD
ncbi:MAG: hypothetical protein AVDCRST_MAG04-1293, partial [uncultured Acetobacteraceae bacterium]